MDQPSAQDLFEFAATLIHSRRNISPRHLAEPGPSPAQLQSILGAAAAAPDHRQLLPWRFVIVPAAQRSRLAQAFGQALAERDPSATPTQIEEAREKAYRAPFLMLAIARLTDPTAPPNPNEDPSPGSHESEVTDAERMAAFGCAIQNVVLSAHAAGFGTGLTSGQALRSAPLRALFGLREHEHAVCCINIGTATKTPHGRPRPNVADYVSELR